MRILLVEDMPIRHKWFTQKFIGHILEIAESAEDAKILLAEKKYDTIFLDHDLSETHYEQYDYMSAEEAYSHPSYEGTGYDVVKWMIEHENNKESQIIIHSMSSGAPRMEKALREAGYNAELVIYSQLQKLMVLR